MRRLKCNLKMSDGSTFSYKADVPDDMTVSKMTESISKADNFFILTYLNGDIVLINIRHIMSIEISEVTDPA